MKKHWNAKDFVITRRYADPGSNTVLAYGYCRKCKGDMHRLYNGVISHYKSHQNAKREGVL